MDNKTLHRQYKIDQNEPHNNLEMNPDDPKR